VPRPGTVVPVAAMKRRASCRRRSAPRDTLADSASRGLPAAPPPIHRTCVQTIMVATSAAPPLPRRTDVAAALEQVRREVVPQGVRRRRLGLAQAPTLQESSCLTTSSSVSATMQRARRSWRLRLRVRRGRRRRYVRWRTDLPPRVRENFRIAPEWVRARHCTSRTRSPTHHRAPITEAGHVRQRKRVHRS
jgi:hypothetical protein